MAKILPYHKQHLQDQELQITIKPQMTEKIGAIAELEGTDPTSWVMLQIIGSINRHWDWAKNEPRRKERRFT